VLRGKSRADETARPQPELDVAFRRFRELLELGEDWDDAGASAVAPATAEAAVALLKTATSAALERLARPLPLPTISPCHDGSIDLFWKAEAYRLLINIQAPHGPESDFYGETQGGFKFKGTFRSGTSDAHVIPVLLELLSTHD
jgi:hypothetical protein